MTTIATLSRHYRPTIFSFPSHLDVNVRIRVRR